MHIYEGILSVSPAGNAVMAAGWAVAAAGTGMGLAKLDQDHIPRAALLSSAFYVISTIHVPIGGTAVHLVLNGLIGVMLGWVAFPAILIALFLQAVMFSMGGPLVLGVNTVIMAAPAVVCYYLFRFAVRSENEGVVFAAGFAAGALAILLSGALNAGCLLAAHSAYAVPGLAVFGMHVVLAVVEGIITAGTVVYLRKVRPEMLDAPALPISAA